MNNNFVYKILEEGGYGNEESVRKEKFFKQWYSNVLCLQLHGCL